MSETEKKRPVEGTCACTEDLVRVVEKEGEKGGGLMNSEKEQWGHLRGWRSGTKKFRSGQKERRASRE